MRKTPLAWAMAGVAVWWALFLATTWRHGFTIPDATREAFGASAKTVFSRVWAHFTAPLLHSSLGHVAYNSVLLLVGVTAAVSRFGPRAFVVGALLSPVASILVDVLLILPLAAGGFAPAVRDAPIPVVGGSVVAFASLGLAAAGTWRGWRRVAAASAVAGFEVALAAFDVTGGFVYAFHLTGFALGLGVGAGWARKKG